MNRKGGVSVVASLDEMQRKQIKDNPERKELIVSIWRAWDVTIKNAVIWNPMNLKGQMRRYQWSMTACRKNYTDELKYFSDMLP